jgi:hypothetical protein
MSESRAMASRTVKPQFTATLLLEIDAKPSFRQLQEELRRIAPQAVLGDWNGPVADPASDPGIEMLSLNGESLSVLVVDTPADAAILQSGPFVNPLWPNAEREAAQHKAHILVVGLEDPVDREAALAKARAVTWVTAAIARLVPAIGVSWADGANLVRAAAFAEMTKGIGQPGANVVPFWMRIMLAKAGAGPRGKPTIKAGTLGLRIFGLRELDYAAAPLDPRFIMQHAYSIAEYLLRSGKRLGDGETIGVEGESETKFAISHNDVGEFGSFPVARLTISPGR